MQALNKMPKKYQWINLFIAFLFSCVEPTTVPSRGSLDWVYFPLEVGAVSIYSVEKEVYPGRSILPETENYLLKEEVISKQVFEDETEVYTLLESKRELDDEWIPQRYFTIRKDFDRAISIIDNIETVELKFPLLPGMGWEATSQEDCMVTAPQCNYFEVIQRDSLFMVNNSPFHKTVVINRKNRIDPLQITSDHKEFAVYAIGTGLIYFESYFVEYATCRNGQNSDCCCPDNNLCALCAGEIEFGKMERKSLLERYFPN